MTLMEMDYTGQQIPNRIRSAWKLIIKAKHHSDIEIH